MDEVPFTDVYVDEAIVDRAADVLRRTRYVKGPECEAFERAAADRWGVDHAVGVNSGTDALLLALRASGVDEGDPVFVPAHTFFATASPVVRLGAKPILVDVDPDTFTMDPDSLRDAIDRVGLTGDGDGSAARDGAVIPVHMHGHPADMDAIGSIADAYGLTVVEDACQAHGATHRGSAVGALGDVTGVIASSWQIPAFGKQRRLTVVGSKRTAAIDYLEDTRLELYDAEVYEDADGLGCRNEGRTVHEVDAAEPLKVEVEDFLDASERGAEPRAPDRVGAKTVELLEYAEESAASGETVPVERTGRESTRFPLDSQV